MNDRYDQLFINFYLFTIIFSLVFAASVGVPLIHYFQDDAYYYFGVARNLAETGRSTFGGINPTNGYHPLWAGVLAGLKALVPGVATETLAFVASAIALAATWGLIWFAAVRARLDSRLVPVLGVVGVFWLTPLLPGAYKLTLNGMGTTLLVPLLLAVPCLLASTPVTDLRRAGGVRLGLVSVVFAMACLARLDAAAIAATFIVVMVLANGGDRRLLVRLATAPVIVLVVYAVTNKAIFGVFVPVSSLAKSQAPMGLDLNPFIQLFWWDSQRRLPTIVGASMGIPIGILLVQLGLIVWQRDWSWYRRDIWTVYAIVCVVGTLGIFAVFAVNSNWRVWEWYKYGNMLATIAAIVGVSRQLSRAPLLDRLAGGFRRTRVRAGLHVAMALGLAGLQSAYAWEKAHEPIGEGPFTLEARQIARDLNRRDPDATLAIGNGGGAIGYFFRGPVLHLEGLVEDPTFLTHIKAMPATGIISHYGVDVLARLGQSRTATADSVCFCEPKRPPFVCYRVHRDRRILTSPRFTVWTVDADGLENAPAGCRSGDS